MNSPEPIPVPNVSIITTPPRPCPAPKRSSARPAASASLIMWTSTPDAAVNTASASTFIHDSSMFAADSTIPARTTAGKPTPAGPVHEKCVTSCWTTPAMASGVAGCGVSMR